MPEPNLNGTVTRMMAPTLLAGVAVGLAGAAHADNGGGTWCPGQPLPQAYNFQITPDGGLSMTGPVPDAVNWDMSVCHDWYHKMVDNGNGTKTNSGRGQVASHELRPFLVSGAARNAAAIAISSS